MLKSWETTLLGVCGILHALATFGKAYFDGDPATIPDANAMFGEIILSVGLLRAKDANVTGGVKPATPEALARIVKASAIAVLLVLVPARAVAQMKDTTDPGAAMADRIAQAAPDLRLSLVMPLPGKPVLMPAVAITPFALSLKDGKFTSGLTIGAGYQLLWNPETPTARGIAVYGLMRSTADGARPLVSVLGVFTPYLGVGLGYQFGGGLSSFRDAAVALISVGTNLGYTSPALAAK